MSDYRECRNRDNCGGWLENRVQLESGLCENCLQERDGLAFNNELATLRAQLVAAEARAERMKIRADTFEAAYNVANRATFQPHNAHWDATGGSGRGCLACQAAREAREQCDDILRAGLQSIGALAEGEGGMMDGLPKFNPRSDAPMRRDEPGEGDDVACEKCGAVALDTGLECSECGHDNWLAVTGEEFA